MATAVALHMNVKLQYVYSFLGGGFPLDCSAIYLPFAVYSRKVDCSLDATEMSLDYRKSTYSARVVDDCSKPSR